jgi:acyl-CoA thioester hydrolase
MDAFQHLNNTVYLRYFEDIRIQYFERTGVIETPPIGPILAATSCRFRKSVTYPDTCTAGARVRDVTDEGFVMEYAIYSQHLDAVAATGDGRIVSFDYETHRKAKLPEVWRERIAAIENTTGS